MTSTTIGQASYNDEPNNNNNYNDARGTEFVLGWAVLEYKNHPDGSLMNFSNSVTSGN